MPVRISVGVAPAAARRRADQKSVVDSSARAATAAAMRSLNRRVDSSGRRRNGLPNVTRVRPGLGTLVPLPMIESVPSMYTGTTGAPVRPAR